MGKVRKGAGSAGFDVGQQDDLRTYGFVFEMSMSTPLPRTQILCLDSRLSLRVIDGLSLLSYYGVEGSMFVALHYFYYSYYYLVLNPTH